MNYWTYAVILIALIVGGINRYIAFTKLTKEQQVEAALSIVKTEVLKLMSDAEIEWEDYKKSGALKKSQVITNIYSEFPILKNVIDQDTLIAKIEELIDSEMENMNNIINKGTGENEIGGSEQ
jgi:hypothetical protein